MLTSSNASNQYIKPDYLSPLPAPMDSKNSPLALLAQTCSAIGADSPNPKLLANIEKSTKNLKSIESRDKSSPLSSQSSSSLSAHSIDTSQQQQQQSQQPKITNFKPYESCTRNVTPDDLRSSSTSLATATVGMNRIKTPKATTPQSSAYTNGRCDSNQSATSQRESPSINITRQTPSSQHNQRQEHNSSPNRASSKDSINTINPSQESPVTKDTMTSTKNLNSNSSVPQVSISSPYFSGYPPGNPYSMDLMTASALMSPHHQMFKAAALGPYLNYARLKGIDPVSMMSSMCRDPYCTGCPINAHAMNKATGQPCPAGCTQCDQVNSKPYPSHNTAAAAYAHAQLSALAAASQMPYVCSWIGGDTAYCGKRFSTSDELFQHLRTHTASMSEPMLNAVAAGLAPAHSLLQRTYPTPPLSPLSTARYHPYGKPSMLPPTLTPSSLAGLPMPPHPSLAQYFSPYSFYGPRLGTPPSMHP